MSVMNSNQKEYGKYKEEFNDNFSQTTFGKVLESYYGAFESIEHIVMIFQQPLNLMLEALCILLFKSCYRAIYV